MTIIFTWKSCHSTKNYISSSKVFEKGDFPKGSYYYADIPCIIRKDGISFSQKYGFPFYIENEELSPKKPHGNMSFHVWFPQRELLLCGYSLYYPKRWYFFFAKIWLSFLHRKWRIIFQKTTRKYVISRMISKDGVSFSCRCDISFWSDNFIFSHKDDTFCIYHLSRHSFLEIWSYFRLQDSSKGRVFLSVVKQCTIEVLSIFVL